MRKFISLLSIFLMLSMNFTVFASTPDKSPNVPNNKPSTSTTVAQDSEVPEGVKPIKSYKVIVGKTYRLADEVKKDGNSYFTSNNAVLTVEKDTGRFQPLVNGTAYIIVENSIGTKYIKVTVGTGSTSQTSSGKGALAAYASDVKVTDNTTVAVDCIGIGSLDPNRVYFVTANKTVLGSISKTTHRAVAESARNAGTITHDSVSRDRWFAEQFNLYRGINSGGVAALEESTKKDLPALANELQRLINDQRSDLGVSELSYDSSMQSLADTRAEEIAGVITHTRPDGTDVMTTHKYAEIITGSGNTAQAAFNSFANSAPHKKIMTSEAYSSFAVGCYVKADGSMRWVVLLKW